MNPKIKQTLILVLILAIEFIGFNNNLKYSLLNNISPALNLFFSSHLVLFKLIAVILIFCLTAFLYFKLEKDKNSPLFIVYLIKGFQVKGSDLVGILNVVFTLGSISWIGIEIYYQTLHGVLNALIYTGFMIIYPLLIANYFLPKTPNKEQHPPKVLITALSMIDEEKLKNSIAEMDDEQLKDRWLNQTFVDSHGAVKKSGPFIWGPWGNLDPIRKSIIAHKACFHEIVLIASSEVAEKIELFSKELKPDSLIYSFLNSHYPNNNIRVRIVSDGISGSDMGKNLSSLERIIQLLFENKYSDKDILFNVTGGTAAISGAMILKAIPGERSAEYARQDTGIIEEIPVDIYQVKELWNELLDKVG